LWLAANVCVSSVVRFRSRALSPIPNVERRYKLWATRHRTIEETFCCALGRVNRQLVYDLSQVVRYFSLTSPSPLLEKSRVVFSFAFSSRPLRGVAVRKSDKVTTFSPRERFVVQMFFLILLHRMPVGIQVCEVKRCVVCRVPSTETRLAPGAQRLCLCN